MKLASKTKQPKQKDSIQSRRQAKVTHRSTPEPRLSQNALRDSEERYRTLAEAAHDAIFIVNREGRIEYANTYAAILLGNLAPEEIVGRQGSELFPPATAERQARNVERVFQTAAPVYVEEETVFPNRVLWLGTRLVPIKGAEGKTRAVMGISRDITARKQAEEALRESEERFSGAFEHAAIGMALVAPDGRWLKVNRALCELTGYSESELLSKTFQDITHPDDLETDLAYVRQMVAGEIRTYQMEKRYFHKLGHVVWILLSVTLIRDAQGEPLYFVAQIQDITERKRAEQDLQQRADEFAALYETTRDLSAQQDLPILLKTLVDRATTLLNATSGFVYLFDPQRRDLELAIERGFVTPLGTRLELGEGMAGRVAQTRQPLIVDNYRDWEYRSAKYAGTQITAVVEVPILFGGELIGVLGVQEIETTTRQFTDADARLLALFAGQAASAMYNARLFAETTRRADESAALYDTTRDLAQTQDLPALLQMIVERATLLLGASGGGMYIYDAGRGDLTMVAPKGNGTTAGLRLQMGEGMAGRIAQSRQPMIVEDYRTWEHRSPQYEGTPITAVVQVPMLYGGDLIGILTVHEIETTTRKFTDSDARLLSLFAGQAASAVYNARLLGETRQRAEHLTLLNHIARVLGATLNLDELLENVYREITTVIPADAFFIALYDPVTDELNFRIRVDRGVREAPERRPLVSGMTGFVVKSKKPLLVRDFDREKEHLPPMKTWGTMQAPSSWLGVPMLLGEQVVGVISVQAYHPNAYGDAEQELLSTIADTVAVSIENARLYEAEERRAARLTDIVKLGTELATLRDEDSVLNLLVNRTASIEGSATCTVMLLDPATNEAVLAAHTGLSDDKLVGLRVPLTLPIIRHSMETGEPIIVPDIDRDAPEMRAILVRKDIRAFFAYPMVREGRTLGFLTLSKPAPHLPSREETAVYQLLAERAAAALENARLFEETRLRAQRQETLYRISTSLAKSQGAQELCETVVRACNDLLGYPFLGIFLLDPETGDRVMQARRGWDDAPKDWRLHPGQGVSEQALLTGKLHYCPDVSREPRYVQGLRSSRSEVDVPIKIGDSILGLLIVEDPHVDAFDQDDFDVLQAVANQLAVALENTRLFDETRQRLAEMEAVNKISTALRAAQTLDEMLPLLLEETVSVLNVSAASIWLHDPSQDKLYPAAERGLPRIESLVAPCEEIAQRVFTTGETYRSPEFKTDPLTEDAQRAQVPAGLGGAGVPIRAADRIIGAFLVSLQAPRQLTSAKTHLLTTVAEIAGNAIHRIRLHEQTKQQLQRLDALHTVDKTITSSLDLRVTLGVILKQITSQLGADAASVLLLNPHTKMLEFAAGQGFRARAVERHTLRLGEGLAGRAALERRAISFPNLAMAPDGSPRTALFAAEGFAAYFCVPLIAKGQVKGVLEIFNRSALVTQADWLPFLETCAEQAAIAIESIGLFQDLERSNIELSLAYDTTLEGWSRALELRDRETEGHTQRVVDLTLRLAREMGVGEEESVNIRRGVLLHDIGKMGITDSILLKPGPLTPAEMSTMRKHPEYAFELLAPIQYLQHTLDIPYCHHEKWDGTGYPRGLKGEEIPLAARIFAVVDVWDALSSDRPYRPAWDAERVRAHIREQSGLHFDPRVVEAFFKII